MSQKRRLKMSRSVQVRAEGYRPRVLVARRACAGPIISVARAQPARWLRVMVVEPWMHPSSSAWLGKRQPVSGD